MLKEVAVEGKSLEAYKDIIPFSTYNEIKQLAVTLAGRKISYLNSTAAGGGVAELLRSIVPLMRGLGIRTEWYVMEAPVEFFNITKKLHNLLQGSETQLTDDEKKEYVNVNKLLAEEIEHKDLDILVVQDPQPLPVAAFLNDSQMCKLWRLHINTSSPNQSALNFILPYVREYSRWIFTLQEYVLPQLEEDRVIIMPPAIDPLTEKNREMSMREADTILSKLGIDSDRPLVTQVSRFDRWKDPIGVIDSYRKAKLQIPNLQLALVGVFTAADDPEAPRVFMEAKNHCAGDSDIHLYTDPKLVGDREVNAFQTGSDVIMQKSVCEGFGLTVTEAMWKGKPVIGGNTGGIRIQIEDGVNGFLVDNVGQAAERLVELLKNPDLRNTMGKAAKESVRNRFLMPRLLRDQLRVFLTCP